VKLYSNFDEFGININYKMHNKITLF